MLLPADLDWTRTAGQRHLTALGMLTEKALLDSKLGILPIHQIDHVSQPTIGKRTVETGIESTGGAMAAGITTGLLNLIVTGKQSAAETDAQIETETAISQDSRMAGRGTETEIVPGPLTWNHSGAGTGIETATDQAPAVVTVFQLLNQNVTGLHWTFTETAASATELARIMMLMHCPGKETQK